MKRKGFFKDAGIAFCITFAIMNIGRFRTTDILLSIFFAAVFYCLRKRNRNVPLRQKKYASVFAVLFMLLYLLADHEYLSNGLNSRLFIALYLAITAAGLFFLFYYGMGVVLNLTGQNIFYEEKRKFSIPLFLEMAGIILLCFLPFFFMNYPAVMTPDSLSQYRQVIGTEQYSNHHPWLHTMLFKALFKTGWTIFGDKYAAIACYTVFQMILSACGVSYVLVSLYELGLKKKYCVAGLVLFLICPYNLLYAVTLWKDVLFSVSVLVLTLTLLRIGRTIEQGNAFFSSKRDLILYIICSFAMCMFRHNGLYAFIVVAVFLAVVCYRQWKQFIPVTILILLACYIIRGPIMNICEVKGAEFAYNICIPLQQVARVIAEGKPLTQKEEEMLSKINDLTYIPEHYQKGGADPMFAWVLYGNQDYLIEHKREYLKLWIQIGLRYPKEYIQAYMDQTRGYWYPMDPEQVLFWGITENEDDLVTRPVLKGPIVIKFNELLTKMYTMLPVYGMLYSMGGGFILLIAGFAALFYHRRYIHALSLLPILFLVGTLFLAVPLVADMRYAYPLMLSIPLILGIVWIPVTTCSDRNGESDFLPL